MRAILCSSSASGHKPSSRAFAPPLGLCLGLVLGSGLVPGAARAATYVNDAQSPAGMALAGAMSARADDASAIFYNPAGLGFQSGLSVLAGVALAIPSQHATLTAVTPTTR